MTDQTLVRALQCLDSASHKLILVGGSAHRLFPTHTLGCDPGFNLLTTEDVDLAAPLELQFQEGSELVDNMEAAGFVVHVNGAEEPVYKYHFNNDSADYVQFIAPLTGDGINRDGSKDRLLRFSGMVAEKLRHVDLLLHNPWKACVASDDESCELLVVNPVAYLVQKLLVLPTRGERQGKDLLYVFDTLAIFGNSLEQLGGQAPDLVGSLKPKRIANVRRSAQIHCFGETSASREAEQIARSQRAHPPTSRQIVGACELGLRQILGTLIPNL